MKMISSMILVLSLAPAVFASEAKRPTGHEKEKCTIAVCSDRQINTQLRSYCSLTPKEFQDAAGDWGPQISVGAGLTCWCSCKWDLN